MRRILVFLVVTAVLVAFAWWLAALPGTVSASVGDISVSEPVSWAVFTLLIVIGLIYLIVRFLAMILRLPSRTRRLQSERARNNGAEAVTRTLLALAGGDSEAARRQARRSRSFLGDTPQTLLLAAYAGRLSGHADEADTAFKLLAGRKDAAFLGLRGLMQGAIARGDWTSANLLARQAEEVNPGAPWLRAERARLAIRDGKWKEALALSAPGAPTGALSVAAAESETDPAQARRLAKQAWDSDPSFVPAALAYARHLRDRGREKKALNVLLVTWGRTPHPALAESYLATSLFPSIQAERVAKLAAAAPGHPETALLRATAALESGQLMEARREAEAAKAGGLAQPRVWRLLADIAEREGNTGAASDALRQAAVADADPHWRCDACGTAHASWHMVCSHCGATGRITWGEPGGGGAPLQIAGSGDPILP